ncbi:MAG TPA: tetratricopeptide repeat protein [Myxococcales bacterium]|nr:tetratricopeptide repeat protein [Myxococcales bacterium]
MVQPLLDRNINITPCLRRLTKANDADLSLCGQAVKAFANLSTNPNQAVETVLPLAGLLIDHGMATEALLLLLALPTPEDDKAIDYYIALGDAHAVLGNDEDALQAYGQLPAHRSGTLIGALHVRRGRYGQAIEQLSALKDIPATPEGAEIRIWLARAHMMQSEYDAARKQCDEARSCGDTNALAAIQYIEGLIGFYQGKYTQALAGLQGARMAWHGAGRLIEEADAMNAVGLVHFRQASLDEALRCFEETLVLAEQSGDKERTVLTLMNVAVIAQERGQYEDAESRYREALTTAQSQGHQNGIMKVTQNLGNLYRFLGQLDQAQEHLQQSLQIALSENNHYIASHNQCLLGELTWLQDQPEAAIALLSQAQAQFEEIGSVGEAADCQRSLAQAALAMGNIEKARTHGQIALAQAEEKGLARLEALTLVTLANVERQAHDGDLNRAMSLMERAKEVLSKIERPDVEWEVLYAVHCVQRDRGAADEAMEAGKQALATLQELASGLPEARRDVFLNVKNRRTAIRELAWIAHAQSHGSDQSGGGPNLARLLDINQRLNSELDLDRLLEYIIDSAILLTGAERGFLLMVDPKTDSQSDEDALKIKVARNIDQENIRNKRYKVSYSIAQQVIEKGEATLTTDAMADGRYSDYLSIHHLKLRSVLCIPMIHKGHVLGALYIDNRFQVNAFNEDNLAFMEAFADQAAIAITNTRMLEERERTLKELAQSQKEVQALNEKLAKELEEKSAALQETEQMLVVQRRELSERHSYDSIVGNSAKLKAVFHVMDRVSQSDIPVLIEGESGTGKELVARAIHYNNSRKSRNLVTINCSSIPENLIESELFGHVRGAFTGASADKKGMFEMADGGTLFLDEIGEMPLEMQAKLLRALQNGEIQKVGSTRLVKVDVRIIAATNRNIREMVAEKSFREDLYYRLAVVSLVLPPLRERSDDIPLLLQHFIEKNRSNRLSPVTDITPETMRMLMRYQWPGNVRELEMAMKNASIFCETNVLTPKDFSNFPNIMGTEKGRAITPNAQTVRPLSDLEREAIVHALEINCGNKKKTAEQLGIDRRTLYNKLSAYGISVERRTHVRGRDD